MSLFLPSAFQSLQVAFRPYVNEVLPLIIDAIQDNSDSAKRLVAVKTLGQVISEPTGVQMLQTVLFFYLTSLLCPS